MRGRVLAAAAVGTLVVLAGLLGITAGLERSAYDARMQLRGDSPARKVAVVAIDDRSINQLKRWPLRRSLHAEAIDRLRKAGVARIVYDVQFTEPSGRPKDDLALVRAVARAPGTVLATGESDGHGGTKVLGGERNLKRIGAFAGAANLPAGPGGVIRRYARDVEGLPTMAKRVVPEARGGLIDFHGPAGTIPTYAFLDLLNGDVPASALRDRVVVVGASAPTLQDIHPTAAGGARLMPGPEIQANAISTALRGDPLRAVPLALGYALVLLFAVAAAWRPLASVILGAAYSVAAVLAFDAGVVLPVAVPLIAALAIAIAVVLVRVGSESRARRAVTRDLARTQLDAVQRLARASELRDNETGEHIERMSQLCERVARELGWSATEATLLRHAATLHDVGKIGLPDAILRKPGKLTDDEVQIMRVHAALGAELLSGSSSPLLILAQEIAHTHHERWDGTGYPEKLAGEAIPLSGRIAAVCDVYDALSSARPYKRAWTTDEVLAEIESQRGKHFDPAVADALITVINRSRPAKPAEPSDPGWVATVADDQASEAVSDSGVPSTAARARSTDAATQVKVGVSRLV